MQDSVKQDRNLYIGGSDIPAVLGISPFKTRIELLREKLGIWESPFEGNQFTEYGNEMEANIRNFINIEYGYEFLEDKVYSADNRYRYHSDGYDAEKRIVLEIKTASQIHDDVNDYKVYLVQLLFGMLMHENAQQGILAVYERPKDLNLVFDRTRLKIYEIALKDYTSLIDEIRNGLDDFKNDLEFLKQNPMMDKEIYLPSYKKNPISLIENGNKLVEFENQLEKFKEIEKQYNDIRKQLAEEMEKAGIDKLPITEKTTITLVKATPDKVAQIEVCDLEKFKAEKPKLYKQFVSVVEKTTKGRSAYVKVNTKK